MILFAKCFCFVKYGGFLLKIKLTYHIYGGYYSYMQNVSSLGYKNVMKVIQEIQEK